MECWNNGKDPRTSAIRMPNIFVLVVVLVLVLEKSNGRTRATRNPIILILEAAFEVGFALFKKSRGAFFGIGAPVAHAEGFSFDVNTSGQIGI